MNRRQMMEAFVGSTIASMFDEDDSSWLREFLQKGFAGYPGMSTQLLHRAMQLRGSLEFQEPELANEEFDDDDDPNDDDEDEWFVRFASMVVVD